MLLVKFLRQFCFVTLKPGYCSSGNAGVLCICLSCITHSFRGSKRTYCHVQRHGVYNSHDWNEKLQRSVYFSSTCNSFMLSLGVLRMGNLKPCKMHWMDVLLWKVNINQECIEIRQNVGHLEFCRDARQKVKAHSSWGESHFLFAIRTTEHIFKETCGCRKDYK